MQVEELSYPSADGVSTVRARLWAPGASAQLRGVVQIAHGMAEHIGRYEAFAGILVDAGFAVCANDHIGHGATARSEDDLGHIPIHGGADMLISDLRTLRGRVLERLDAGRDASPGSVLRGLPEAASPASSDAAGRGHIPYILFGHSLGSFMARVYLARHPEDLDGVIICGTGQQPRLLTDAGRLLTRLVAAVRGERFRSAFVDSMGVGAYARAIPHAKTRVDWISTDRAVVQAYLDDPWCGQLFTVGGYAAVSALAGDAQRRDLLANTPRELPLLFISGVEDPVGDRGRGVERAVEQYRSCGFSDVEQIIYPHMRHEILNEPGRDRVCADILDWLGRHGCAAPDAPREGGRPAA